jgi:hypothetical protein
MVGLGEGDFYALEASFGTVRSGRIGLQRAGGGVRMRKVLPRRWSVVFSRYRAVSLPRTRRLLLPVHSIPRAGLTPREATWLFLRRAPKRHGGERATVFVLSQSRLRPRRLDWFEAVGVRSMQLLCGRMCVTGLLVEVRRAGR